jgi:hypothetical protein
MARGYQRLQSAIASRLRGLRRKTSAIDPLASLQGRPAEVLTERIAYQPVADRSFTHLAELIGNLSERAKQFVPVAIAGKTWFRLVEGEGFGVAARQMLEWIGQGHGIVLGEWQADEDVAVFPTRSASGAIVARSDGKDFARPAEVWWTPPLGWDS